MRLLSPPLTRATRSSWTRSTLKAGRNAALILGLVVATTLSPAVGQGTVQPAPASTRTDAYCFVNATILSEAAATTYTVFLSATTIVGNKRLPNTVTGEARVSLYAGNSRYDVPLHAFIAEDYSGTRTVPTLVVVKFDQPTTIDSAIVSSLEPAKDSTPCTYQFPVTRTASEKTTESGPNFRSWLQNARQTAPIIADPAAVDDPPACKSTYRAARTVRAAMPVFPLGPRENVDVVVDIALDDHSDIIWTTIEKSTSRVFNQSALLAARSSQFETATFRCRPVAGYFRFYVSFRNP